MELSSLSSISPIDGRYRSKTQSLGAYFSEFALIKYRVRIEIEYFLALLDLGLVPTKGHVVHRELRAIYLNFNVQDAEAIKTLEKTNNHDVKSVEYFIKERLKNLGYDNSVEFVHFGLTSQDINNTAIPLSVKDALEEVLFPAFEKLLVQLSDLASTWERVPMLARTHGQPASPTRLGKEIRVFSERLSLQLSEAKRLPHAAKFGGATGNFNAHHIAYPSIDWVKFANEFITGFGLQRSQTTTQIEHYDYLSALCDAIKRLNNILIDLNRDCWTYISMDYFKQHLKPDEIGSSAMPHKVNPIDFENSEGNLGLANALFEFLAAKLPISRLQRDLTDSTVLRNIGVPMAHTLIAIHSTSIGLSKLLLNEEKIQADLEDNWIVIAEAIQTVLRRENYPEPYEILKILTRTNAKIRQKEMHEFIDNLEIRQELKEELKRITPWNYTGI
ncbi:MAG: adenylosuccinate lyase [Bacteroidetes bacterium]|nr:adenylosuccinate lyase [Bacteroidota bacterium]MBM3424249.1 adenylosuccinate lyase [Bacteroidota bacterium]